MRTAKLARDIAEVLAGTSGEAYYYLIDRNGHRTIYGPFPTRKDAEYAGYFAKPVADRDALGAAGRIDVYFLRGVQGYDAEEIRSLSRYPDEYQFKSVKLRKGSPPLHASWKKFDEEFRNELRDSDYERYRH
jgi:hypothetical protein